MRTRLSTNIHSRGKKKNELKAALQELSGKVKADTGYPLVFIIDELDRCRPTFAIELLERVKHIFDIPDMVFVFGINRDELCSSIQSVYGEIDADTYLRRFFDMEFLLPDVNSEVFCKCLIERYRLEQFFTKLSERTGHTNYHLHFEQFIKFFQALCAYFSLSLRDIDYCVRLIVFVGKNATENYFMSELILPLLMILRLKNNTLYQEYMRGDRMGSEVMNYIDESIPPESRERSLEDTLNELELRLYLTDRTRLEDNSKAVDEFERLYQNLKQEQETPYTPYLSERTQKSDIERIEQLRSDIAGYYSRRRYIHYFSKDLIARLSELIELSQSFIRA